VNGLSFSRCPERLRIKYMPFHITLSDTTQVSVTKFSGTKMGTAINNRWYETSE